MPKATPLLSICIITFNRADFLIQSLESITSQIDEDVSKFVEVIISDNASTDNTKDVALANCHKYGYISYFRNSTNLGAQLNVFEAIKRAKGEYVWVFGDDDLFLEGALKKVLPHLQKGTFDFIMTNKMVKNTDLSETLIENQNPTYDDTIFSDIKDLCCEFGFFTNLGFVSTAIFKRQDFMVVDPNPYLDIKMEYAQNGVMLEAFNGRPCLYISDILICQRQFTNVALPIYAQYVLTTGVIRMFKILKTKGVIDYTFVERIKENPLGRTHCTIIDEILLALETIAENKSIITQPDWMDIMEFFLHLENDEYKKRVFQIYSEYMSRLAVEHITGEVRTRFLDRLLEADTLAPEEQRSELYKTGLDMMGQWIASDDRVNALKELWKKLEKIRKKLVSGNEIETADKMLSILETAAKQEYIIPQHEWLDIMETFLYPYFMSDEFKKRVFQIYSEYISRLTIERITGEVRTRSVDRLLAADTGAPEKQRFEPESIDVDIMGPWLASDDRVIALRRVWKYSTALLRLLRRVTTPAIRRMIWRLYQRFWPARVLKL